jgi:hypothetical protein
VEFAPRTMKRAVAGPRIAPAVFELAAIVLAAWALLAVMPLARGELGISWDALNHQIYLGWTAAHPRFGLDVLPAQYQTYQYPYLYWPVYQLALGGASGAQAGLALASLQLLNVPPVWIIARHCIPAPGAFGAFMRFVAVSLAFLSGLVLSMLDSTSNDLLAAAPFLWAAALALGPATGGGRGPHAARRRIAISGLLGGISVACKLSNGPLVLLLPVLWALAPGRPRDRALAVLIGGLAVLAGFAVAYAPWGWQLWSHFGNPFFPLADNWFEPVRAWVGWRP